MSSHPCSIGFPASRSDSAIGFQYDPARIGDSFSLLYRWERGADGFYSAGLPALSVYMSNDGSPSGLVSFDYTNLETGEKQSVNARRFSIVEDHRAMVDEGQAIRFIASVADFTLDEGLTEIIDAELHVDFVIPHLFRKLRHRCELYDLSHRSGEKSTWRPAGDGVGSVPINRRSISPGRFASVGKFWGLNPIKEAPDPFVVVGLGKYSMSIRSARTIEVDELRYAEANGASTQELSLKIGTAFLSDMLVGEDESILEIHGAGIGNFRNRTGYAAVDDGSMSQRGVALTLKLRKLSDAVKVEGTCIVDPIAQPHAQWSIGPQVTFEFSLYRAWLFACGVRLGGFHEERWNEMHGTGIW